MKNASISVDVGSCVTRYILARPNEEQLHYCTPGVGVGVSEMLKVLRIFGNIIIKYLVILDNNNNIGLQFYLGPFPSLVMTFSIKVGLRNIVLR